MLSVFCSPTRYTQGKNATVSLGKEMAGLGLRGPALLIAGRSARRHLEPTCSALFTRPGFPRRSTRSAASVPWPRSSE